MKTTIRKAISNAHTLNSLALKDVRLSVPNGLNVISLNDAGIKHEVDMNKLQREVIKDVEGMVEYDDKGNINMSAKHELEVLTRGEELLDKEIEVEIEELPVIEELLSLKGTTLAVLKPFLPLDYVDQLCILQEKQLEPSNGVG